MYTNITLFFNSFIFLYLIYYIYKSSGTHSLHYSHNIDTQYKNGELNEKYIDLMKKVILNSIYEDGPWIIDGSSWPKGKALTMIGTRRLNNIYLIIKKIIRNNIEGDVVEAGCWRGGAMMYARAILNVYDKNKRKVFMCDSFSGIPPSTNSKYEQDKIAHKLKILNTNPVENVYKMLKKLDLERGIIVVKGYFNETLHRLPSKMFSLIRLDGDTYLSTTQAITALYPKLSVGGYIIVDDYLDWVSCRDAITDYRKKNNINEEIIEVFHNTGEEKRGVYWQKKKEI